MTARSWREGDPEPADHPPLVDNEGVTWLWTEVEPGAWYYEQQQWTHHSDHSGLVGGGRFATDWAELLAKYGPMREATAYEAGVIHERWVTWPSEPSREAS